MARAVKTPTEQQTARYRRHLSKRCQELQTEIDSVRLEREKLRQSISSRRATVAKVSDEIAQVVKGTPNSHDLQVARETISRIDKQLVGESVREQKLRTELNAAKRELTSLRTQVKELQSKPIPDGLLFRKKRQRIGEQTAELESKIATSNQFIDEVNVQLASAERQRHELASKRAEQIEIVKAFRAIEAQMNQLKKSELADSKLETRLTKLEAELLNAQSQVEGAEFLAQVSKFIEKEEKARVERARKKTLAKERAEALRREEEQQASRRMKADEKRLNDIRAEISRFGIDALKRERARLEKLIKTSETKVKRRKQRMLDWLLQQQKMKKPVWSMQRGRALAWSKPSLEVVKHVDLPRHPALHNMWRAYQEELEDLQQAQKALRTLSEKFSKYDQLLRYQSAAESRIAANSKIRNSNNRYASDAPRMDVEDWKSAEQLAVQYMRWLGFSDANATGGGADEGKDVDSRKAVAQVKDMGTGVPRPAVQQLYGVAMAEDKIPIFFARSYSNTAISWAEANEIALFKFNRRGEVEGVSNRAHQLLGARAKGK